MDSPISATEAARAFADLLDRVRFRGESFVVMRRGEAVCRIAPVGEGRPTVADLDHLLRSLPRVDADFARDVKEARRKQPRLPRSRWRR
jgi:antitoxin (DNA-binding transcriptional repressor) of toxin-antitoxin stability system